MKKTLYISIVVGLVLGFQNCGKSIVEGQQSINTAQNSSTLQGSDQSVTQVDFDLKTAEKLKTYNLVDGSYLVVDFKDGSIHYFNHQGQEQSSLGGHIEAEDLSTLKTLIASASICQDKQKQDPNMLCAMLYRAPYAYLSSADKEISLGEAFDSCHSGSDICDQKQKTQLIEIVQELSEEFFKK